MKHFKKIITLVFSITFSLSLFAADPVVVLKTSEGDIKIKLYPEKAPVTVDNFLTYVKNGHYNNTIFHRVIDSFMVQGGGFTKDFQQKDTLLPIKNEADNGLKNKLGTIAMARTSNPHSATAQFFINVNDNYFLDFKNKTTRGFGYCVFGEVIDGLNIVLKISKTLTGVNGQFRDVPQDPILINQVELIN